MIEHKVIEPGGRLFIIGGGVTGLSAAVTAAHYGVSATIVEKTKDVLGRFAECTRWVDPTEYDWPREGWDNGVALGAPFPFVAAPASTLTSRWRSDLRVAVNANLTNVKREVSDVVYTPLGNPPLSYNCKWIAATRENSGEGTFDAMVLCSGLGNERCSVDEGYSGFEFWQNDPYEEPSLGLPNIPKKVLISGSGDGALQNLIRMASGFRSAKVLLHAIATDAAAIARLRHRFCDAEESAHRSYLWSGTRMRDHYISRELDLHYSDMVASIAARSEWSDMVSSLDKILISRNSNGTSLSLIHPCDHFSTCYGLNRFLARLIMSRIETYASDRFKIIPKCGTVRIRGDGHECNDKAQDCHGKSHSVFVRTETCHGSEGPEREQGKYNVIAIHHGINLNESLEKRRVRQLLPSGNSAFIG